MPFPITDAEIEKTEKRLGHIFPTAYRNAMKVDNGGEVLTEEDQWDLYPFLDTADRKRLSRTSEDIIRETESAQRWDRFPKNGVAIAGNGFGDHLFFLPDENDDTKLGDRIYVFWHEQGRAEPFADSFENLNRE